jgi:nicotinamide-nucleotide amidase
MNYEVTEPANALIKFCIDKNLTIATAESCTGGLVAGALTEVPGSSAVVDRGFVTYSNAAKQQMLGVTAATLKQYGAVSRQTAEAMAQGALSKSKADLVVSITGIAGPGGGTPDKPVGLVHFAAASRNGTSMHAAKRFGDVGRAEVRHQSVVQALRMLRELAEGEVASRLRKKRPEPPKERVIKEWPDKRRKQS